MNLPCQIWSNYCSTYILYYYLATKIYYCLHIWIHIPNLHDDDDDDDGDDDDDDNGGDDDDNNDYDGTKVACNRFITKKVMEIRPT